MTDLRPSLAPARAAFGVPATVIPPDGPAIQATVIPLTANAEFPAGGDLAVTELRKLFGLSRAEVPNIPRGTIIELDPLTASYTVERVVVDDGDDVRVLVR